MYARDEHGEVKKVKNVAFEVHKKELYRQQLGSFILEVQGQKRKIAEMEAEIKKLQGRYRRHLVAWTDRGLNVTIHRLRDEIRELKRTLRTATNKT